MSRSIKLRTIVGAFLCFAFAVGTANAGRVPDTNAVSINTVTEEELHLAAVWEDGSLYNGSNTLSKLHYPIESKAADCTKRGCTNGCTIGFGFNLGAQTAETTYATLVLAGVPSERANLFKPYAGARGPDAVRMCGRRHLPADAPTLTRDESWSLMRIMLAGHKQNVVTRARDEGVLDQLIAGQFAVLVVLDYQNPTLSSRATDVWRHLRDGRYDRVEKEIRERSGTRFAPQLQRRRNWEGDYWQWATSLRNYLQVQDGMLVTLPADNDDA